MYFLYGLTHFDLYYLYSNTNIQIFSDGLKRATKEKDLDNILLLDYARNLKVENLSSDTTKLYV